MTAQLLEAMFYRQAVSVHEVDYMKATYKCLKAGWALMNQKMIAYMKKLSPSWLHQFKFDIHINKIMLFVWPIANCMMKHHVIHLTSAVWSIMLECSNHIQHEGEALMKLPAMVRSPSLHFASYDGAGWYHIYCPGGAFDLRHRWDTSIIIVTGLGMITFLLYFLLGCIITDVSYWNERVHIT